MHQTMETYLLGRDHISIPQLQSDLDCNYLRAAEMLRCCIEQGWVSPRVDGLRYSVNRRSFPRQEWTPERCAAVAAELDEVELDWLEQERRQALGAEALDVKAVAHREKLPHMLELGLMHEFCGKYFLTVTDGVLEQLYQLRTPLTEEDILLYALCDPIIKLCADRQKMPEKLLELEILPSYCKDYIRQQLEQLLETDALFVQQLCEVTPADERKFKFVLLEAFLSTWNFDTKEEYNARIRTVRRTLSGQFYCTPLLSRLINQVYRDICLDLTLANIREIRHLINSE